MGLVFVKFEVPFSAGLFLRFQVLARNFRTEFLRSETLLVLGSSNNFPNFL